MPTSAFHLIDIGLVVVICVVIAVLYLTRRINRFHLALFFAGALIGALWEFPLHFLGPRYRPDDPIFIHLTEWPLAPILQPALHCLWDGALFLIGYWLMRQVNPAPYLERFRWRELLPMVAWGLVSALAVELVGSQGGWVYVERAWNPALIRVNGGAVTLLPIAIWVIAPVVFYLAALWLRKRPAFAALSA